MEGGSGTMTRRTWRSVAVATRLTNPSAKVGDANVTVSISNRERRLG